MTVIIWIVRALVILIVLRLVLRMLFGARRPAQAQTRGRTREPERLGGTLVRDPNCGTHIVRERAIMVGAGAAAEYFCSEACRDKWFSVSRKP